MEDIIYTEDEAYNLIRDEQEKILNARGINFNSRQREKTLVKKILKSNPEPEVIENKEDEFIELISQEPEIKEEEKTEEVIEDCGMRCQRCGSRMDYTGGGPSGKDYKCIGCGFGLTQ